MTLNRWVTGILSVPEPNVKQGRYHVIKCKKCNSIEGIIDTAVQAKIIKDFSRRKIHSHPKLTINGI